MKLLITGFEAAHGEKNASQILLHSLEQDPTLAGYADRLTLAVLPLNRAEVAPTLRRLLNQADADLALLIGQAPRRDRLQLERFAQNLDDFTAADNGGHRPRGAVIAADGPAAYRSNLPHQDLLIERWLDARIPADFSNHAGNYLCNHALYHALHMHARGETGARSAFLHIPVLPEQATAQSPLPSLPLQTLQRAVAIAVATLCDEI